MASYGDVIYNPTAAYVATWIAGNTFGTPVNFDYIGKISYEFESDTDELMSAGRIVETLAIPKKVTGEMTQGSMDYITWGVLTGFGANEYSTTPNRYYVTMPKLGGEGLPYFGLIVAYAATGGANVLVGFPKCKLDTVPGFDVDQNKFRVGSAGWTAVAAGTTGYAGVMKKYETASAIPTSAAAFLAFFNNPTNVFA